MKQLRRTFGPGPGAGGRALAEAVPGFPMTIISGAAISRGTPAAASLKLDEEADGLGHGGNFPRHSCRGLIEACCCGCTRNSNPDISRGTPAAASLKLLREPKPLAPVIVIENTKTGKRTVHGKMTVHKMKDILRDLQSDFKEINIIKTGGSNK